MTTAAANAEKLVELLKKKNKTIAAAESCTGGAFVASLVLVPGASEVVLGGTVVYTNEIKAKMLGIDLGFIERYSAVSPQVARRMAVRVRKKMGSDVGVAVTGYAHTGSVWFAVSFASGVLAIHKDFGDIGRREVIDASVNFLVDYLSEEV
jgi:nicotinamide-nucleotide amidase